ncbi:endoglucanase [Pararhizobium capsulatum DSM 1112]|uniref:Endoglucanase n=1 Tax=Pararhizobium capsulatum DSM 1112 TaxID=1121113 RepID=A0ABU0BSR2_9HYPH|nr:glycoside hydrolase family 9 protein [Pararhizobium capsulatum]MDQ0321283.1 endoglucanase [Pararhizobium capsulatum DSM 1112]
MILRNGVACVALVVLGLLLVQARAEETIVDGAFEQAKDGFWGSGDVVLSRDNGKLCAAVPAGGQMWDRLMGVNDLSLKPGKTYRLKIKTESREEHRFPILVQRAAEPWTAQVRIDGRAGEDPTDISTIFVATEAAPAQLVFHLGGAQGPWHLCIDDVTLAEVDTKPATAAMAATPLPSGTPSPLEVLPPLVNQSGYFLDGPKRVTIISSSAKPLDFRLIDASGATVGEGTTKLAGFDPTVGADTHVADFSAFHRAGEGYRIVVGDATSFSFSIGRDVYSKLRIDALSWFYPQRSGIEIDGAIAGAAYARPAGHINQEENKGDSDVGCLSGSAAETLYGDWHCGYRLDVTGGWYDAGDNGKYAVNGAISAAQLLGTFERGMIYGGGASAALSDSLSRIPENGNGVPDLLDEARWELEFLLKMIVPDGQPLAGMVHHKVHDTAWTVLPLLPHMDAQERALHRPSTAATLDFAATAAQGARLFAAYDDDFSQKLLTAAKKAWLAAAANPVLYAPTSDGLQGGGDYDDDDVIDETYWAAAELFISTGEKKYLTALHASPYWAGPIFSPAGAFHWRNPAALGRINLALYGDKLPKKDLSMIRKSVVSAAGNFLKLQQKEPFGQIYRPAESRYDWGSNHAILQNMIVMAAGYDLSGDRGLLQGIRESMDYILGRNAMNMSYVTGYGSVSPHNQHSRWYAHQVDASFPNPPVGSLAGGPNSTPVDEIARNRLQGCVPQTCYVDDIAAYGSNEIAINWNAPLVYVASFLADAL